MTGMKKCSDIMRIFIFIFCVIACCFLINDSVKAADEISSDRLKKLKDSINNPGSSNSGPVIKANPGAANSGSSSSAIIKGAASAAAAAGGPGMKQPEFLIPGVSVLTIPPSPFGVNLGDPIQFIVSKSLNFFAAGVNKAFLEWTIVNKKNGAVVHKSSKIDIKCIGGVLSPAAFDGIINEFRSPLAGDFEVFFRVTYKIFGQKDDIVAVSNKVQINYTNPSGGLMVSESASGFKIGAGGSGNSSVGLADKMNVNSPNDKIAGISFVRVEPGDVKERNTYTWQSNTPKIKEPPSANAKALRGRIAELVKNGSDAEIEKFDKNKNVLDDKEEKFDEMVDGKKVKWSGINVDGGGPAPGSEKTKWTVLKPNVTPGGAISWEKIAEKDSDSDSFQYAFAEPTEPFKDAIEMSIRYKQIDFKFKRSSKNGVKEAREVYKSPLEYVKKAKGDLKDLKLDGEPEIDVSGGDGQKTEGVVGSINIKVTIKYSYTEEKEEAAGNKPKSPPGAAGGSSNSGSAGKISVNKNASLTLSFCAGDVVAVPQPELKVTSARAVKYEKVLDTTAPKVELLQDSMMTGLADANSLICTTGDLVFIKIKVTDNNKYSPIRLPYLTYQTGPAAGGVVPLSAVPLKMEAMPGSAPDVSAPRPFPGGNVGIYYALAPVPYNIKGKNAVKWFVDVFDGASAPHSHNFIEQPAFGNHNQMDLGFDGIGSSMSEAERRDRHGNGSGFLDIYDNDRPNIVVRMWKVDRAEIFKVGEFIAAEDYFIEDCYYAPGQLPLDKSFAGVPGLYRGFIPDGLIKTFNPDSYSSSQPFPYFPPAFYQAERKPFVIKSIKNQVDFSDEFKYKAGFGNNNPGTCPVVFEDVKYLFTVDIDDNIEFISHNGFSGPLGKLDKTDIKFAFNDKGSGNMTPEVGAMYDLEFDPKTGLAKTNSPSDVRAMWYLGPEDPAVPMDKNDPEFKKIPTFEHIFHAVSNNNGAPSDDYSLKFEAVDKAGHHRKLNIYFQIKEVTNELRVLEEKYRKVTGPDNK